MLKVLCKVNITSVYGSSANTQGSKSAILSNLLSTVV